jgi:hypothetical protein
MVSTSARKRTCSDSRLAPERDERTVVMSSWFPHEKAARSCASARRILPAPPTVHLLGVRLHDACNGREPIRPSDGRTYTQCTGLPATTFGTRSPVAGEPHHDADASFVAVAEVASPTRAGAADCVPDASPAPTAATSTSATASRLLTAS